MEMTRQQLIDLLMIEDLVYYNIIDYKYIGYENLSKKTDPNHLYIMILPVDEDKLKERHDELVEDLAHDIEEDVAIRLSEDDTELSLFGIRALPQHNQIVIILFD